MKAYEFMQAQKGQLHKTDAADSGISSTEGPPQTAALRHVLQNCWGTDSSYPTRELLTQANRYHKTLKKLSEKKCMPKKIGKL